MVLSYAVPAHAELSYLDLKGIDNLVDHPGASPIYGYMALQNSLENHRFFGNYGQEKKGFPCYNGTPKIKKALQDNNDCPQDYTTMWLQRLFPSQSGSFGANNIDSDPIAGQLTPEIIGRILGRIAVDRDHDPTHRDPNLEQDLLHILYQGMNPVSYGHWNATLTQEEAKLSSTLKRLQPTKDGCVLSKSQVSSELVKLQKNFADVQAHLGRIARYAPLVSAQDTNKGKLADFQLLAHTLVGALNESRPTAPGTPSLYPAYLPEQTLLAFLIKKSESKKDLVRFIKGLKEGDSPTHHSILKDPDFLTNEHKKTAFLSDHWSPADYHPEAVEQNLDGAAQNFIHHPEKLLFYMMQERTSKKPIPPVIGMGSTKHESLEQSHYKTYADCGETSLRNFFNVIFYDKGTQKFNSEIISFLKKVRS
jgi:hypothetical protein